MAPQDRYEVRAVGQGFAIKDMALRAYCGLGGPPLAWETREGAAGWLKLCYRTWGCSPAVDEEPPPSGAWPLQRNFRETSPRSPWEGYVTPLYGPEHP